MHCTVGVQTIERLRWHELRVRDVLGICHSSVSAVLLQRFSLRHDAFRLQLWRTPRRLPCDGLKGFARTREAHMFLNLSRMPLTARAPSSRRVGYRLGFPGQAHEKSGIHNNGRCNNLVQGLYLCVSTVVCCASLSRMATGTSTSSSMYCTCVELGVLNTL